MCDSLKWIVWKLPDFYFICFCYQTMRKKILHMIGAKSKFFHGKVFKFHIQSQNFPDNLIEFLPWGTKRQFFWASLYSVDKKRLRKKTKKIAWSHKVKILTIGGTREIFCLKRSKMLLFYSINSHKKNLTY